MSDPPTVTVMACYTKNGREAVQPIAAGLADRLRPWLARKAPGRPVFDGMTDRTAEMLRVDLEAAGIPYETASGVADFHALRAAYVSQPGGVRRIGQDLSDLGPAFDPEPDHRRLCQGFLA